MNGWSTIRSYSSGPCSKFCVDRLGGSNCSYQWRSSSRPCRWDFNPELSRCHCEGEASARTGCTEGYFLYQHPSIHGKENEPVFVLKCNADGALGMRSHCYMLRRAVRWLRQVQGHWPDNVASQHHHGSPSSRDLECRQGLGGIASSTALDNGQIDIGLLLALVEDPPAALFSNRAVAPLSRGRAFAPMAEQRWKELDTISSRRSDIATSR